jgi:hypothetical protein
MFQHKSFVGSISDCPPHAHVTCCQLFSAIITAMSEQSLGDVHFLFTETAALIAVAQQQQFTV